MAAKVGQMNRCCNAGSGTKDKNMNATNSLRCNTELNQFSNFVNQARFDIGLLDALASILITS